MIQILIDGGGLVGVPFHGLSRIAMCKLIFAPSKGSRYVAMGVMNVKENDTSFDIGVEHPDGYSAFICRIANNLWCIGVHNFDTDEEVEMAIRLDLLKRMKPVNEAIH